MKIIKPLDQYYLIDKTNFINLTLDYIKILFQLKKKTV